MSSARAGNRLTAFHASFAKTLALGTLRGLWTLEDLDPNSPLTQKLFSTYCRQEADLANARARARRQPQPFPDPPPLRNIAREWINNNAAEWDQLLQQHLDSEAITPIDSTLAADAIPFQHAA